MFSRIIILWLYLPMHSVNLPQFSSIILAQSQLYKAHIWEVLDKPMLQQQFCRDRAILLTKNGLINTLLKQNMRYQLLNISTLKKCNIHQSFSYQTKKITFFWLNLFVDRFHWGRHKTQNLRLQIEPFFNFLTQNRKDDEELLEKQWTEFAINCGFDIFGVWWM